MPASYTWGRNSSPVGRGKGCITAISAATAASIPAFPRRSRSAPADRPAAGLPRETDPAGPERPTARATPAADPAVRPPPKGPDGLSAALRRLLDKFHLDSVDSGDLLLLLLLFFLFKEDADDELLIALGLLLLL